MSDARNSARNPIQGTAPKFVILMGAVSLFADATYEGARGITGPLLSILGASAAVLGIVAGFGELAGYGLRSLSGYLSAKTGKYWAITIFGYAVNLLAVPLLALTAPFFYIIDMGVDALAALVFGRLFDRWGISLKILAALVSAGFAPLVFLGGFRLGILGMALWGVGIGAQESVMRRRGRFRFSR